MDIDNKVLILNTGGTFNKVYEQISGRLIVPKNNKAVESILEKAKIKDVTLKGIIYKDSLDITKMDREILRKYINKCGYKKILIIHGTDTMDKTASYLFKNIKNKQILLTGAMEPYSIDPVEAVSNMMSGYGFLKNCKKEGIYISMHGFVKKYNKITKNRKLGVFECL